MSDPKITTKERLARTELWLFDLVSGLTDGPEDWEPVARHCLLTESKAREITRHVLSDENIQRIARI